MWKWKSDWGWCLGGAYFLAKFQAGGAYSGGAYKKSVYFAARFASVSDNLQLLPIEAINGTLPTESHLDYDTMAS